MAARSSKRRWFSRRSDIARTWSAACRTTWQRGRTRLGDTGVVPGGYVTGWVKRGPRGVIGTNRACAAETVGHLLADFDNGKLARDVAAPEVLSSLLAQRGAAPLTWKQWQTVDVEEPGGAPMLAAAQ